MLSKYIKAAMEGAQFELLEGDGVCYGEIPGFEGVYANATDLESCQLELEEALEGWLLLRASQNLPLPDVEGFDITVEQVLESKATAETLQRAFS